LAIVLAAGGVLWTAPAWAQPGGDQARANAIYKDAKERMDAGEFQKAFEFAQEAERIFAHPSITFLKGRALRKLGRLRDADDAYKAADNPQLPKALIKPLADERAGLNEELRTKGQLRVVVEPKSAVVSVDGETVLGGWDNWLPIGKKKVEIAAPGHRPAVRSVEVQAGETVDIKVVLAPLGGSLTVLVPGGLKGVEILVDGLAVELAEGSRVGDRTPLLPVSVGAHEVTCSRGNARVAHRVEVGLEAAVQVTCEGIEPPSAGGGKALGWGGVAVGAGLLSYGAYGLGSWLFVDRNDERGIVSTNKHWLGSVYALSGVATGVASYLLFVREPKPVARATSARPALALNASQLRLLSACESTPSGDTVSVLGDTGSAR